MSQNKLLALAYKMESIHSTNVLEIGKELVSVGADNLTNGGFWIWDIGTEIEYYSPKFRKSLGFDGESDFPSTPKSWQEYITLDGLKEAVANFEKAIAKDSSHPYSQNVVYRKKNGGHLFVNCSGIVIRDLSRDFTVLVGSHVIISETNN